MLKTIGLLMIASVVACKSQTQAAIKAPVPQCVESACSLAMNFTSDMEGDPDTRPTTWGKAKAWPYRIQFHPPHGYRVRIMRVYGDFVSFPKEGIIKPGTYSETSWGLMTTAPGGSSRAEYSADDCFLWLQSLINHEHTMDRMAFDHIVKDGGLLEPDGIMILQVAVSLNTTGLEIHQEPTLTVVYNFEKEREAGR